jgi:N-acetylglucosaminyldiphosphoundecaprenol N-acetyl-beta-D-mannosaminyltransferase
MALSKASILGVSVTTSSREAILSFLSRCLATHHPISQSIIQIVTPNPEQIVLAQENEKFRTILNNADIALPDGAGLVWGMKHGTCNTKHVTREKHSGVSRVACHVSRIPGREFMEDLCRLASEKDKRVLLYGGRGGVAGEALNKLKETIPSLDGLAMDGAEIEGETSPSSVVEELIRTIRSRNIHVVFFGLGAPKQEFLMYSLTSHLLTLTSSSKPLVLMSTGGAFDTISGRIAPTPEWMEKRGLEWLWRLVREPWRWKRQLSLLEFMWRVFMTKA